LQTYQIDTVQLGLSLSSNFLLEYSIEYLIEYSYSAITPTDLTLEEICSK